MEQGMKGKIFGQIFANQGSVMFSTGFLPIELIHIPVIDMLKGELEHSRLKVEKQHRTHDIQDTWFHFT